MRRAMRPAREIGTCHADDALTDMSEKLLSKGGDKVVLADAARAEKKLRHRPRQWPALGLFVVIALAIGGYKFFFAS